MFLLRLVFGVQVAGQLPQVLAGVILIDNLHRAGKVLVGEIPNPRCAIEDHDFLFRIGATAIPRLGVYERAKLFGPLNRPQLSGRIGGANGEAFRIPFGLRKYTSQLALKGVRWLPGDPAARIRRVKGAKRLGVRVGNWLTPEQTQALVERPAIETLHSNAIAPCWRFCSEADFGAPNSPDYNWQMFNSGRTDG